MFKPSKILISVLFLAATFLTHAQNIAVVDVQKVFDGYQKLRMQENALISPKKSQWKN